MQLMGWLTGSEIYPLPVRGAGTAVQSAVLWGSNTVITLTLLTMINAIGVGPSMWVYAAFNVVAWQLTFALGVVCGRHGDALPRRGPGRRALDLAAAGLIAAGAWATWALPQTWEAYDQLSLPLRVLLRGQSKGDLDPGRVLSVLALAWAVLRCVPRDAPWLRGRCAAVLTGLGQRSLPVFASGVVVTGLSSWALTAAHRSLAAEVAVNAAGLAGLAAAGHLSRVRLGTILGRALRRPAGQVAGIEATASVT